jgi:hypothetical protein
MSTLQAPTLLDVSRKRRVAIDAVEDLLATLVDEQGGYRPMSAQWIVHELFIQRCTRALRILNNA